MSIFTSAVWGEGANEVMNPAAGCNDTTAQHAMSGNNVNVELSPQDSEPDAPVRSPHNDDESVAAPRRASFTSIVPVLDDTDEEPAACQEESAFSKAETRGLRVILSFIERAHRLMKNRVLFVVSQLILWTLLVIHVTVNYGVLTNLKYLKNTSSSFNNSTNSTSSVHNPAVYFTKVFVTRTFTQYMLPVCFSLWTCCRKQPPTLKFGPDLVRVDE
jgi:hypothetical protein